MAPTCPSENTEAIDQSKFWSSGDLNWDEHRIGWTIAGGCTVLTIIITLVTVWKHCRNYHKPNEQRQVLRIIYMPPVYAIISFFSYRYFRRYTYYELTESVYQSIAMSAFLLLLIEYVAVSATGHSAEKALERKGKRKLPIPFCCWRYRPTKPYFMHTVKWSVLQYVIVQPAITIAGMVCEAYNVLCVSGPYSVYFANVYLQVIGVISSLIATYGLLLFHGLTEYELEGRRPWAKSLTIDLITVFVFFQSFIINALEGHVIKATQYWTETNVADGLTALVICIEMVPFSLMAMWAYTWTEYVDKEAPKTSIWRPLWDSINYMDFAIEIYRSLKFYYDCARGNPQARFTGPVQGHWINNFQSKSFDQAFGVESGPGLTADISIDEVIQPTLDPKLEKNIVVEDSSPADHAIRG